MLMMLKQQSLCDQVKLEEGAEQTPAVSAIF